MHQAGPIISLCLGKYSSCEEFAGWINAALETLIMANRNWLARHRVPSLYASGVRYQREPREWLSEHFDAVPIVLSRRWGDCDDLVGWRIAEIRNHLDPSLSTINLTREDSRFPSNFPTVKVAFKRHIATNKFLYHVQVRNNPSRTVEDPSLILGMRPARR